MEILAAVDPSNLSLAQWGVPGVLVTVLAGVIVYLYRDNKRLNDLLLTTTRETLIAINNFVEVQRERLRK